MSHPLSHNMLSPSSWRASAEFLRSGQCRRLATETQIPARNPINPNTIYPDLKVGVVLARSPFITRTPTPFEKAYFSYQKRLRRALSNPFPVKFYFKPGELNAAKFKVEDRRRELALWRNKPTKKDIEAEQALSQGPVELMEEEEFIPEPRRTIVDFHNNPHSLNRLTDRTVYLVLRKYGSSKYTLPEGNVFRKELLHEVCCCCCCCC